MLLAPLRSVCVCCGKELRVCSGFHTVCVSFGSHEKGNQSDKISATMPPAKVGDVQSVP